MPRLIQTAVMAPCAPFGLNPCHHAIERLARRRVERGAGRRVAGLASAPRREALPCGSPCRSLPGTRTASAARRGRTHPPLRARGRRGTVPRCCTRISGNAKPVMAPVAPASSSSSRNTPPRPPKIPTSPTSPIFATSLEDARRLERRRRILELDRPRARDLLGDPRQEPRLHRVAGDRRIVLDDDFDVDRLGKGVKMPQDRVRIQLRHARRADHDGGRPASCACRL